MSIYFSSGNSFHPFVLQATDLSYSYDTIEKKVINSISYTFSSGKVYTLVGPSGSGKSTFLRLLAGLLMPEREGQVELVSSINTQFQEKRLSSYVSYLTQEETLFSWKSVEQNIGLALTLGPQQISIDRRNKKIEEALHFFHLEEYRSHFPHELSGGLKKLTALARAYVENRPVLLLDEPFSSIDVFHRGALYDAIQKMAHLDGKLIFYVTHDFYDCHKLSDEILFLAQGALLQDIDQEKLYQMRDGLGVFYATER